MAHDITMRVLFGKLGLERLEHLDEYLLELEPVKAVENDTIEDMVDEIVEDTTTNNQDILDNHEMLVETPDNEIPIEELIDEEPFIEPEFEEPLEDYNQFEDYENFDDYEQFYDYDNDYESFDDYE